METMNVQMRRLAFFFAVCLFVTTLMAQSAAYGQEERQLKPGNKVAMKLYKKALKKEGKDRSCSIGVYKSLAEDGYAPAQYRLYLMGQGDEWLEKAAVGGVFDAAGQILPNFLDPCANVVARCSSCVTRASNGGLISTKEIQMLEKDKQVLDQTYTQMMEMSLSMASAVNTKDANYFPKEYKGKYTDAHLKFIDVLAAYVEQYNEFSRQYNLQMMEIHRIQERK